MADLQSKPLIELNLDTREITITNNIKYIYIDKNIANIFLQIYREDSTGLKTYLTKEELNGFIGKMFLIKPVTNNFTEITGINTEEFASDNGGGVLRFIIPTEYTNRNGIVKCEIHINKNNELLASDRFVYNVKQSLVTQFNNSLLEDSDFPILQQLILDTQKASNIDDTRISKTTTYSSDKVENIKEQLSSQIKDKANKTTTDKIQQQINNLVLGAVGDGNNAEVIQARGNFGVLNDRLEKMETSEALEIFNKNFKRVLVNSQNILDDCFLDEVYELVNASIISNPNMSNILFLSHKDSVASFKVKFDYFDSNFSEDTTIYLHFKAKVLINENTGYNTPSLAFNFLLNDDLKGSKGIVLEFTNDFKEYILPLTFGSGSSIINNFNILTQKPFDCYFKDFYITFYKNDEFGFSLFDKEEIQDKKIIKVQNEIDNTNNRINEIDGDISSLTEINYEDITSTCNLNQNGFYKYDSAKVISSTDSNYAYFSPIEIKNTDKYSITGKTNGYANLYIIKDDNGKILTAYPNEYVNGTILEEDIEVVIPSGGTKLLVNNINNSTVIKKGNGIKLKDTDSKTKLNLAIIGDSLSDSNLEPHTKYHSYLKNTYNVKVLAVSGSGYFNPSSHNTQFYNQAKNITVDDDIILIFGSFNDMSRLYNGEVTMGTISDSGTTTIYGCINTTLDNIYNINPNAIIGLATPTPWQGMNEQMTESNPYYEFVHGYIKALKDVANKRQIPILDLFHCSNLRPWIEENRNEYYQNADGTHPNEKGHKRYLYPQFREFLRTMNWNI